MSHNYFNIEIEDSMLTNIGYDGNVITDGKYYLALKLSITNNSSKSYTLDYNNFRLVVNDKNIYPTLDRGEYFIDYGKPYYNEKIKSNTTDTYVLVYELDSSEVQKEYEIRILDELEYGVGEITPHYKIIKLNPTEVLSVTNLDTYEIGKTINLKNTNLGYTTFKVNSYSISNSFTYTYDYCYSENNCTKLKDKITTDVSGTIEKTTLLILNVEYNLDKTTIYANNIKTEAKFFDNYLSIQYTKDNKTNILSLKNKTNEKMKDNLVFELRDGVKNADSINLLVTVRNKRYTIKLK
jgi:hypothetical protein